jgi:D-3-phosphoglycerate dehydrogenase
MRMAKTSKRVLIAVYPFLTGITKQQNVEYVSSIWDHDPSSDEIESELIRGQYDGLLIGTKTVKKSIASKVPSLKVISRVGVGFNNIDVEFFKAHGVVTTYTPFGPTDSTAEMALAMILAGTRRLTNYNQLLRDKTWKRDFGLRIMDATIGIAGFGRIGKRLACLLKPFGCEILLHDIAPDLATAHAMCLSFVDKGELFERSDVISLHMPLKSGTLNWIGYADLAGRKKPLTLVNTARGGIVNEQAIFDYLSANPESYYCCDVFEEEPYTGPLIQLSNTLLTPHASSFTVGSRKQTELLAVDNCMKVLNGEPCTNIVEKNE